MIQRDEKTTTGRATLGPADHGRRMTLDEFFSASEEEGYRYELIEGVVEVTPVPNRPHDRTVTYLLRVLDRYCEASPQHANYVTGTGRLVQRTPKETSPEPDLSVYRDFPLQDTGSDWEGIEPIVVVEVLSPDRPAKDLERNRRIYLGFAGIQEYWIIDPLLDPKRPTMLALRRAGDDWEESQVASGGTYTTDLLPGLTVDLSKIYPLSPPEQSS